MIYNIYFNEYTGFGGETKVLAEAVLLSGVSIFSLNNYKYTFNNTVGILFATYLDDNFLLFYNITDNSFNILFLDKNNK